MKAFISLLVLTSLSLSGCSLTSSKKVAPLEPVAFGQSVPAKLNDDLIVQNLIFALTQLPSTHPLKTTLSLKPAKSTLADIIEARFNDAGYGIKHVESDEGEFYVSHTFQNSATENGSRTTYMLAVGPITIERDYTIENGLTRPNSVMTIDGVQEQDILLNDDVFGEQFSETQYKEVYFNAVDAPVPVATAGDIESVQLPVVEVAQQPQSFGALVKQNMREIMRSNFASLFDQYEVVQQNVLVFPNDSLKLGSKNKKTVRDYVNDFNPETDIMSVVGCSHGRTATGDGGLGGNQLLALGRANRVKEALIFSGLDQAQIYEEGCWDDEYFDEVMPRRGVVLTHQRLIEAG